MPVGRTRSNFARNSSGLTGWDYRTTRPNTARSKDRAGPGRPARHSSGLQGLPPCPSVDGGRAGPAHDWWSGSPARQTGDRTPDTSRPAAATFGAWRWGARSPRTLHCDETFVSRLRGDKKEESADSQFGARAAPLAW